jgi:putative ABC transport system permease protein
VTERGWRWAARMARRDLSRSLRGLRLLFLCIFLGVATLATVGSLAGAITGEIAARGAVILGGDVEAAMTQRLAGPQERAAFRALGPVSETIRLRAMARGVEGPTTAVLSELKAVDSAYPLYGQLLVDGRPAGPPSATDIYLSPEMAQRLAIGRGQRIRFGGADFRVAGFVDQEPDRVGEGFTLGPVAIVSLSGMNRTGLVQPGSLYTARYRIRLPSGADADDTAAELRQRFAATGLEVRSRNRAAPGASRFFDRMGQFLTLIGLGALVIAGIGVGNGVGSYLARKRTSIALLKVLGATSGDIARIYLLQIGGVALLATAAGIALGALLPVLLVRLAGDILPVQPAVLVQPLPLLTSAAYGMLVALAFVLPHFRRARREPAAGLLRGQVQRARLFDRVTALGVGALAAIVAALAIGTSDTPGFAAGVLAATVGVFLLLALVGLGVRWLAARLPRPRSPLVRLAVAGLHRPGAQTGPLVIALGLALTLFVTLSAVESSLSAEIEGSIPQRAPARILLDIPSQQRGAFERMVREAAPGAELNIAPVLRGTITQYGDQRVADLRELPDGAWFLRGERGISYSAAVPQGSTVVAGSWWPPDYRGPPIVSFDREAADLLGLTVGDRITVTVLGRPIEARIASLRELRWENLGFNFLLVYPPSVLQAAPHSLAASLAAGPSEAAAVTRATVARFPSVSVIDVGDIIGQVSGILRQVARAILIAASVAVLAGIAVLVGALAAAREARSYDSVILKTLGATRRQLLGVQALEYAVVAAVVLVLSCALGLLAAWFVIVQLFEFTWAPDFVAVAAVLGAGAALTLGIALLGAIPLLRTRPAQALRQL